VATIILAAAPLLYRLFRTQN